MIYVSAGNLLFMITRCADHIYLAQEFAFCKMGLDHWAKPLEKLKEKTSRLQMWSFILVCREFAHTAALKPLLIGSVRSAGQLWCCAGTATCEQGSGAGPCQGQQS